MTDSTLKEIVRRAVSDSAFRTQLRKDPTKALAGISLTADERSALASGDPTRLTALGVDQRMSKAFVVGATDGSSRVVINDPDNVGSAALINDEASGALPASSWDANLRANEGVIGDPTSAAGTTGLSTWDVNLRTNEANIDSGDASQTSAFESTGTGASSWDAHLAVNEGNIDTGAQVDPLGATEQMSDTMAPSPDTTPSDAQLNEY